MKRNMKFAVAAMLLAVFAAAFAGEALARPNWMSVKLAGHEIRRNPNSKNSSSPNHLTFVTRIDITNNSKDRVVTAIFDRTTTWNGKINFGKMQWNIAELRRGTDPIKVELYPSQTYKFENRVTLDQLGSAAKGDGYRKPFKRSQPWSEINAQMLKGYTRTVNSWNMTFQVESRSIKR